jgi:hypothetical protein
MPSSAYSPIHPSRSLSSSIWPIGNRQMVASRLLNVDLHLCPLDFCRPACRCASYSSLVCHQVLSVFLIWRLQISFRSHFFLMSTVMLVGPVGIVFFISLFRPTLPFRCSSDPPGERMKPAVFYLIEDVAAVDFQHGRDFRRALHERHVSPSRGSFKSFIAHVKMVSLAGARLLPFKSS